MPNFETATQFRNKFFSDLSSDIAGGIEGYASKELAEKNRKQELQDAISKQVVRSILGGDVSLPEGSELTTESILGGADVDLGNLVQTPSKPSTQKLTSSDLSTIEEQMTEKAYSDFERIGVKPEEQEAAFNLRVKNLTRPYKEKFQGQFNGKTISPAIPQGKFTGKSANIQDLEALKPANIPDEDWALATDEEKIQFLKEEGLLDTQDYWSVDMDRELLRKQLRK